MLVLFPTANVLLTIGGIEVVVVLGTVVVISGVVVSMVDVSWWLVELFPSGVVDGS